MDCETSREDLLEVLYGEADAAVQARFETHQAACAACREELHALRSLRGTLAGWKLPEQAAPRVRGPWAGWRPLAAAAGLLLALGGALGLSGAELQYARGGLSVRLGRPGPQAPPLPAEQERRYAQALAALEARVSAPASVAVPSQAGPGDDQLLERVAELIRESEARQAQLLSASMSDLGRQSEAQRRYDLARISAGFSYLEGKTGQQVARTTELMGYMLEASQKR
jgi:hypothetical protein